MLFVQKSLDRDVGKSQHKRCYFENKTYFCAFVLIKRKNFFYIV